MRYTARAFCAIAGSAAVLVLPACSDTTSLTAVHAAAATPTAAATLGAASAGETTTAAPKPSASPRAAKSAASVTIAAVGDTMLGDTPRFPPDPGSYLDAVKATLDRGAQIVFGNLEGTLTTSTASKCGPVPCPDPNCFAFRDPPGYARYLKQAGFHRPERRQQPHLRLRRGRPGANGPVPPRGGPSPDGAAG